jgi:hypothetical protein
MANHRGPCHPVSGVFVGEFEVRPWRSCRANDLRVSHQDCDLLGVCSVHLLFYVLSWSVFKLFTWLARCNCRGDEVNYGVIIMSLGAGGLMGRETVRWCIVRRWHD